MNETSTAVGYGLTSTTVGYSQTINGGTGAFFSPNNTTITTASSNYSLSQAITSSNNMVRQVRVAVFTVKRNKENKIVSAEFTKELWVEVKNGASLELSVAKELEKDFDPANTVIKEMYSIRF